MFVAITLDLGEPKSMIKIITYFIRNHSLKGLDVMLGLEVCITLILVCFKIVFNKVFCLLLYLLWLVRLCLDIVKLLNSIWLIEKRTNPIVVVHQ